MSPHPAAALTTAPSAPAGRSEIHWQQFSVPYRFPVAFTEGVFDSDNPLLAELLLADCPAARPKCLVYIDDAVTYLQLQDRRSLHSKILRWFSARAEQLELVAKPHPIEGGERCKQSLDALHMIHKEIHHYNVDRHGYVIAIGGGALLDAVGFMAATAHRGIRHVRIPTTVLSQNDSGVGVKNGINYFGQKNWLGTFCPPHAVINDLNFIAALPERDRISGTAEAVKVALIRDLEFFCWLEQHADAIRAGEPVPMRHLIERCAALHMHQIAHGGDPFERGSARPLDFGHWSAHKLEILSNHQVTHGEAVAIGIALDARYSVLAGLLEHGEELRIITLLQRLGLPLWHPLLKKRRHDGALLLLNGLEDFRAHLGGELCITELRSIGQGVELDEIDHELMASALDWLESHAATDLHGA